MLGIGIVLLTIGGLWMRARPADRVLRRRDVQVYLGRLDVRRVIMLVVSLHGRTSREAGRSNLKKCAGWTQPTAAVKLERDRRSRVGDPALERPRRPRTEAADTTPKSTLSRLERQRQLAGLASIAGPSRRCWRAKLVLGSLGAIVGVMRLSKNPTGLAVGTAPAPRSSGSS